MINLISFFYKPDFFYQHKDNLPYIKKNLEFHIDQLYDNGWDLSSLVLKTNFDFEYKNIISKKFYFNNCYNLFLTKIVAAYEVADEYPNEIIWQHDHDTYQIKPFDKNQLQQEIISDVNMCNYWPQNNRPQGASVFYRSISKTLIDMYNYITIPKDQFLHRKYTEENVFEHFRNLGYSINTNLSYRYNTSLTKFTHNKRFSDNPYCVHGNPLSVRFDRNLYHKYTQKNPPGL